MCYSARAQDNVRKNIQTYSQNEGLSSPNIHKIVEDKFGFIWIATQDGLNRFDGMEFVKFNKSLPSRHKLFSSDIRDLVLDNGGDFLWVICNQGGIDGINLETGNVVFSFAYPADGQNDQWKICAAAYQNKIYIGTSGGLEIFDTEKRLFVGLSSLQPASEIAKKAFSSDIRTINISETGVMVLGLLNEGAFFYNLPKHQEFWSKKIHLLTNRFWPTSGVFAGPDTFYFGLQDKLLCFNYNKNKNYWEELPVSEQDGTAVNAITVNKKGQLLLSAGSLRILDIRKKTTVLLHPLLDEMEPWFKSSTAIYEDRLQNIWIGSRLGLCLVKASQPIFEPVKNNAEKLSSKLDHVFAVCAINDSAVLAGTRAGLLAVSQNGAITNLYGKGLIQNIVRISDQTFLVSGYNGCFLFSQKGITSLGKQYPELKAYQNWQFNSYVKMNDSISILGTESNKGILEWHTKTGFIKQLHSAAQGVCYLPSDIVNSIYMCKKDTAFILSDLFISVYTPSRGIVKKYNLETGQGHGIYMHMTAARGDYWIAAYGQGLIQVDGAMKLKKVFNTDDGLTNTGVYSVFNYKDSLLLITSNFGISVLDITTKKISAYYQTDGLQSNVFEEASRDSFHNNLYAGGANGYVKMQPSKITAALQPPVVYFTRVFTEGEERILLDTADFSATGFSISNKSLQTKIYFSGLYYQNAARVTFKYKIKELGNSWIDINRQNFISLIGLSPGTYHLQVKAANEDGVWSEPKELVLIFEPKWYQTWWFKLLIALITGGIIYAFYRYRIRQIKKQHEIRKNIATDLHDDLGSTLNSVKVFTNLAISGVKQEESLQQVKDNLTEATMSLRDMIWVLDDSLDTVDELVTRLKQFALPITAATNMEFIINAGSDVNARTLSKEEKRNLFLICKEAINNSIKYSGASKITVDITPAGKKIQITISDNGRGFDEATVKKGYGLKNMQYRAGQVKYKVTLYSSSANGTNVKINPL